MEVVTGVLPGSDLSDQEVLVVAHLCHPRPGANDNASGCGLGMEIARAISTLVGSGALSRPRRSIRFLFVPEMYGTVSYIDAHPEWPKSVVAGINLDMVGEDQASTGSCFIVTSTPWSCPSAVNDIAEYYTRRFFDKKIGFDPASPVPIRRYRISGYAGGSDHYILVDPTVGIPTVFLGHWPDRFYHSNMDSIDKTDPEEFRLVGLVAASYVLDIASFDKERARFVPSLVESGARARLWSAAQMIAEHIGANDNGRIGFLVEREEAALRSILDLVSSAKIPSDLESDVNQACESLRREAEYVKEKIGRLSCSMGKRDTGGTGDVSMRMVGQQPPVTLTASVIPVRHFRAPLDMSCFWRQIGPERTDFYKRRDGEDSLFLSKLFEFVNLMDSRRTLSEIIRRVAAEFGEFKEDDASRFLDDLVSLGLADLLSTE